jgi:flagellar basal-body rod protein FlgG
MTEAAMLNDVERLRVTSQNIANSSTLGFKREIALLRPGFEASLRSSAAAAVPAPLTATAIDARAGALRLSGNPLDVALEGDGFFVLAGASGEVYTRQGNFQLDAKGRLVSSSGLAVMGEAGELVLPTSEPRIDQQGALWDGQNQIGRLRVVRFDDPASLVALGGGIFSAGTASARNVDAVTVRQGFIEAANVTAMQEMVRLIETVRHFEASQRMLRGYDTMLGTALSTIGSV